MTDEQRKQQKVHDEATADFAERYPQPQPGAEPTQDEYDAALEDMRQRAKQAQREIAQKDN